MPSPCPPGPYTCQVSLSGLQQWCWCGSMVRSPGSNRGKGSLGVPLLGGAFCACTWHFFYNSESLEVLVALQAALTVMGNATMCFAAYRIYRSTEERSKKL
uniref:uncharacterized protein LOC101306233 isoform X2 n=1 Tax=Fragaria vesca subsp. vesca TaxID=101020 RepID=UPI0005CA8BEB|nr:PREDICTED: uncharacterized protein LOC101306233 isoform X2 [Fragaria vesca subsp. vesca]